MPKRRDAQKSAGESAPVAKRPKLVFHPELNPCGFVETGVANIVSSASLGCRLDLTKIAQSCWNCEYDPKRFHALIFRTRDPRATLRVFSSGKMIVMGTKSEEDSQKVARRFAQMITKQNYPVNLQEFWVQNIVGTAKFEFDYSPERLCVAPDHIDRITYEPQVFPGLIYRIREPYRMAVLIFLSGKVVVTGAKSITDLNEIFERMYPILNEYRKTSSLHVIT
jgi:transcription initiation factor TFIID TATA-box-binding protein